MNHSGSAHRASHDPRDQPFETDGLRADLTRRTGRSAVAVLAFAGLRLAVILASTAILARLVPPQEQGLVAMLLPPVLIAAGLAEFGLAQAAIQRERMTHRLASAFFWVNLGLGATLAGVAGLLSRPVAAFYGAPEAAGLLIALTPVILLTAANAQFVALLRRQLRLRALEAVSLAALAAAAVTALAAAYLGAGAVALVIQLVVQQGLTLLGLAITTRWRPAAPCLSDIARARRGLRLGLFLAAERLVGDLTAGLPLIMAGRAFGAGAAGLLLRSEAIALMPFRRVGTPLSGAFLPALSRLQGDGGALTAMLIRQVSRANLIVLPAGLALCLAADAVVAALLGPGWEGAAPLLAILSVLTIVSMALAGLSWTLVACGRGKALLMFRIGALAVNGAALLAAAPFGLVALVAARVAVRVLIEGPALAVLALRLTPLRGRAIAAAYAEETVFACAVLAAGAGLRHVLDASVFAEGAAAAALVAAMAGARVAAHPGLRRDVATGLAVAAGPFFGRIRKG